MKMNPRFVKNQPSPKEIQSILLNALKLSEELHKALGNHGYTIEIDASGINVEHETDLAYQAGMGGLNTHSVDPILKDQFIHSVTEDWIDHWKMFRS